MDLVEVFYETIHGQYPFDTNEYKEISQKTIDYLKDNGLSDGEILKAIEEMERVNAITYDALPESLWQNSLLKKHKFYFHNQLQIRSPMPIWDPITNKTIAPKFYLEMRIKFTEKDLLDYFYKTMGVNSLLQDEKKDLAALKYLLDKYKKLQFIEPIDFVLFLIDFASGQEIKSHEVLSMCQYEATVIDVLQRKTEEAKLSKLNQVVWR